MDAFTGEIRAFCFEYAPKDWAFCRGTELPIAQNPALAAILTDTYGGNLKTSFKLPDLRGRAAMGASQAHPLGSATGAPAVALTSTQIPPHNHGVATFFATFKDDKLSASPDGTYLSRYEVANINRVAKHYHPGTVDTDTTLAPAAIGTAGKGAPHPNMQPYLTLNYCICLTGEYPEFD